VSDRVFGAKERTMSTRQTLGATSELDMARATLKSAAAGISSP